MKIKNRLLVYFLSIAFFILVVVDLIFFFNISSRIIIDNESKLAAVMSIQELRVESAIASFKDHVMQNSRLDDISEYLGSFNETGNLKNVESLKTLALDTKSSNSDDFKAVYILDRTNKIIASSETEIEYQGLDIDGNKLSETAIKIIAIPNWEGSLNLLVVSPLKNGEEFVGYIAILEDTTAISLIVNDHTGLGDTGETVIAYRDLNGDAAYLVPPRFSTSSSALVIPSERTDIAIVQAMLKNETILESSRSYNEKDIYAITRYIDETDWGIVVKIDKSELFLPIYYLGYQIAIVNLIIIIIILILSYNFARSIAKPIEELKIGAEEIQRGNYKFRSNVVSKDEIGILASTFNQMTISIAESQKEIASKVKAQTGEIIESQNILNDQRRAMMNVLEDVEEEKENVSLEKDKIETVLQSIGDGVFVVDAEYNIVIFNNIAAKLSGYSEEEAIGKKYFDILKFTNENTGLMNDDFIKMVISKGEIQEMTKNTIITRKNGQKISVADSAAPLLDRAGKVIGCVVVFRDVTREREIDRAKTEFVSLASHQLRTPLSAINWYAEMLINGDAGRINKEQRTYLDEIYNGNQRMVELVNSLLNVSRLDLGTFEIVPKPIKINEVIDDVADEMKHELIEKKQKLISSCSDKDPEIMADPKLMRIIMQNLISNAIKYSPDGGKILVSMKYDPKNSKSTYNIIVSDKGYGIPDNQKYKIFTKLFRADNIRLMDTRGTGLGLYIVKSILDEAGGSISFESTLNKGTTFIVSLPWVGMKQKTGTKSIE